MSLADPLLPLAVSLGIALLALLYRRRRAQEHQLLRQLRAAQASAQSGSEFVKTGTMWIWFMQLIGEARSLARVFAALRWSWSAPSFSQWMVRGAVRRLPVEMSEADKARWGKEMGADVASVDGWLRRLRYAFGVWRKGAPKMPVAGADAPRSAD